MNALDQLNEYLARLERQLRFGALARGAAILLAAALGATVLLVLITNAYAFSATSVTAARVALWLTLFGAIAAGIWLPWRRLNRRVAATRGEQTFPEFEERLLTVASKDDAADPFLQLLAADTLHVARASEPARVYPWSRIAGALAAGGGALGVLMWLIMAGPGFWGHGASLLWAGPSRGVGEQPFYDIKVQPGDAAVRRRGDQAISAQLVGIATGKVLLWARYHSATKWETVLMTPGANGAGYEFLFAGIPESVEYFVEAGGLQSKHFNLRAVDLPGVKQIRVTYNFPAWMGAKAEVQEKNGDLRAVEGTEAAVEIEMDRPLNGGSLVVNEQELSLKPGTGNWFSAKVRIDKDGLYYVAGSDNGQRVRLSEDYFIEARKENPPTIKISKPGRDYKASPIEEVAIQVNAEDDFGLQEVNLHYSVNGGEEKAVSLLKQRGARDGSGSHLLALEDFQMAPGDLVSFYATAKDARTTARTDMFFIEAQPFDREYRQSQQGGGGGGGGEGEDQNQISQRQKEIISATWNQQRDKRATAVDSAEAGKFLSEVQSKLRDQAKSLAKRMQSRELSQQNHEFMTFTKEMTAAAEAMDKATAELKGQKWPDAMPHEQKALQHLLRAEAVFRDIQVAFGQKGGGGGGGGAARDLSNLFDLELDTEKNQYETGQQQSAQDQKAREVDEALQKLEQLARRQQELAEQQKRNQQSAQQKWQQEMLRREAEQLKRQMEQMARG